MTTVKKITSNEPRGGGEADCGESVDEDDEGVESGVGICSTQPWREPHL